MKQARVVSGAPVEALEGRRLLAGGGAGAVPRPDHVVIVIEENRNFEDVIGYAGAPYINSLLPGAAQFTDYHGLVHPSQPNYIGLFSGSTHNVYGNSPPPPINAPSLGGELTKAGFDFTAYSEDLPFPGYDGATWLGYARRHAPWTNFPDVSPQDHRPLTDFPSDFHALPDVAFVIPNVQNDMHDEGVEQGDAWLREHLDPYVRWARTHNSLFVLTWDEDNLLDEENHNRIPTLLLGEMVKPGLYGGRLDHYNLLRTLEEMYGLPYLGASATAAPFAGVWDDRTRVVGRHVFYNNSAFDRYETGLGPLDDAAVAPDTHALLPGERARPGNYTSYSRGLNGVMVDVRGLPAALSAEDFQFKVGSGTGADPAAWAAAPAPSEIQLRRGAGTGGSDRIAVAFPDGAIRNQWLQVTVKATERAGLATPDVFYFGNVIGESSRPPRLSGAAGAAATVRRTSAEVSTADLLATREALRAGGAVTLHSPFDHNRDGRVDARDLVIVRLNLFRGLRLLLAPPAPAPEPPLLRNGCCETDPSGKA